MILQRLFQALFVASIAAAFLSQVKPAQVRAQANASVNFGEQQVFVVDYGADNTGSSDSRQAIQNAINSCTVAAGCEVHFAPGTYQLYTPVASAPGVLVIPTGVPITLSGGGQLNTILQDYDATTLPPIGSSYTIIYVAPGSNGFSMHDIGFENQPATPTFSPTPTPLSTTAPTPSPTPSGTPWPVALTGALAGSEIDIPMSFGPSLYNLHYHGAYDVLELGQTNAMNNLVRNPSIRALTSENGNHCFARLDGGDTDVFIRGIYAEANNTLGSSILCIPSENGAGSGIGINGLFISDSNFEGFTRGIAIPAFQLTFRNAVFDNLFIDNVADGPAFEIFVTPGSASHVDDIRISHSTLISSSTACVVHGGTRAVRFINDSCTGGQAGALPTFTPCATQSAAERGYALVQVTGSAPPTAETVSVTVNGTAFSYTTAMGETAADIASALGSEIAGSSLSATPSPTNPCPPLVPLQSYMDYPGPTATPVAHYSIGPNIELYSYQVISNSPTIAVSPMTGSGVTLSLPNLVPSPSASATFAPGDGLYVGMPSGSSTPYDITAVGVGSEFSEHGAGLHLQGGSAMTFTGNNFAGIPQTNSLYGVLVELGATYSAVQVQNNDVSVPSPVGSYYPVFFNGTPTAFSANSLTFSDNVGYNPVGPPTAPTATPSPACGSAIANPYPFNAQVYVSGGFTDVKKNGTLLYGMQTAGSIVMYLGGGETLQVDCSTPPSITWFGS